MNQTIAPRVGYQDARLVQAHSWKGSIVHNRAFVFPLQCFVRCVYKTRTAVQLVLSPFLEY